MTTTTFTLPICLPVQNFYDEAEAEEFGYRDAKAFAFGRAAEAEDAPAQDLLAHAKEAGLTIALEAVAFDEFDAGNLSHAGAHYLVAFKADRATAEALARFVYGDTDCLAEA